MMSDRRFREVETQNRIPCNLCGSNGASVRCDKCQSMAFCLSCDDMYHRHPKRRYHLRKAVALEMPNKYFDGISQSNTNQVNAQSNTQSNTHIMAHPSKMPVPPPRRKKKGITLSSIKETFASTGNKLRRYLSNEKLSMPSTNGNRYLNECRPKESPLIDKPMQTIRTQTLQNQNQREVLAQNNNFGSLPTVKRHNSFPAKLPEPDPTPPPLPPPRPKPEGMIYENFRKTSLPAQNLPTNVRTTKVSSSIGDLSQDVTPGPRLPERKISVNTLDRRNCSLHDLRGRNTSVDDISNINSQQFYPQFLPNQLCYGYPVHPWATNSLNNSIEDMNLNDVEDYDSDVSARQHMNRMKRASIKRCKSAFQMYPGMGHSAMSPVPPFLYPYYYGHHCSGHSTPLPPCASPHPHLRPYNMNSRGSVDNMSTTSSSKDRSPSKSKYNRKQRTSEKEQFSDSGERSATTSSSRQQSDFDDDEENFYSVSDNNSSDESDTQLNSSGQWSCKFCTYINDKKNTICEICSKTNKKSKKNSDKSGVRLNRRRVAVNQSKHKASDELRSNNNINNNKQKNKSESDFDENLIKEQKEIEKELIRRLDNQRRIERENQKIQRKEEYLRKKSLGLTVEPELIRQIRKDEESDQMNESDPKRSDKMDKVLDKKFVEKCIENKSTEYQTNQQKHIQLKTSETMTDTESGNVGGSKCLKSVECQYEDNSIIDSNNKSNEISFKTKEQNIVNQNLNTNSVSNSQTNGPINPSQQQSQQNGYSGQSAQPSKVFVENSQQIVSDQSYNQNNVNNMERPINQSGITNPSNYQNNQQTMSSSGQSINNFDDRRQQYGEQSYNQNNYTNGQTNQANRTPNQFGYQNQQNNISSPLSPTGQSFSSFDERRPYGPDSLYNQNCSQYQNPYNNFPINPLMSQNLISMNPMMSGFPMAPPMFATNPLQNMYTSPFAQSLSGSQTGLDRFGNRSNSITSEQPIVNPLQSQISSRYSSCENLQSITQFNDKNQQKSQIDSGLQLLQILREAEKNGFTSDDVEVALNFSPDKPIEWLEENWNKMCETVLTLTNNQIMQNVSKTGNKKLNQQILLTEEEAKEGLRSAKGNIWQAIDRCAKSKQIKTPKVKKNGANAAVDDQNKGSFTLKISEPGAGSDNMDTYDDIESSEASEEKEVLNENQNKEKVMLTTVTVHTSEVQQIEGKADRKTMERLLTDWKIEKLSSDRFRQQEKERQKIRKFMELQKKMSEFDSEDSELDIEVHEPIAESQEMRQEEPIPAEEDHVLPEQLPEEISEDKWQVNSEFEFVDKNLEPNMNQRNPEDEEVEQEEGEEEVGLDFEEYNSNTESDLSDEFDKIDARIQAKLRDNFNVDTQDYPVMEPINSEIVDELVQKLGESSSSGHRGNDLTKDVMKDKTEEMNKIESSDSIEVKGIETNQEISKSEAKMILKEIDRNMRRSLEEVELMEQNVNEENKPKRQELPNHMYDETFGWARTEFECELCCKVFPIEDLLSMISCTHFACRECLQKYYGVQIRERQRLIISCPFCDEPDINLDDDEKVFEYLGLFDQVVKHLVPADVYELFQRKLRDRALMRDPNFLWCTQCSSGFIAPNPQAKTIMCPDCKNLTCALCKKKWKKQHMDITCEQFAEWEKANDPSFADQQLDKHLKEFGIECPNCKFRYQLAKGGCMHFRCIQCSYDFCGGCARPFKMGTKCGVSPYCEKMGLHAHHPRNCLFYLRDKDTDKLQSLLDKHKIKYKTKLDSDTKTSRCPVMEQKHTSYGLKDEACNRYVENAGLCRLHYKEYLGDLIWKNGIDPIHIFNNDELELVLKRENIKLPPKEPYLSNSAVIREEYHNLLIELIIEKVPLNLHH